MKGSIRLFSIAGISIKVHVTFILLLLLVLPNGFRWIFLVIAVFLLVTIHELCHSLVARTFGVKVRDITLLPIGGVASMARIPKDPIQELLISLAGPLSNIAIILAFFFPMRQVLGPEVLFSPLSMKSWPHTFAYIYWVNLAIAGFNLLPAFPMDGGRILRALLAMRMGYRQATRVAAGFGHVFALAFAYFGIVKLNVILIAVAVFVYLAASHEELDVDVRETLKKFRVCDILPRTFATLGRNATVGKALEIIFHAHQEDFPVVEGSSLVGFVTRQDIMRALHTSGKEAVVQAIMRTGYPTVRDTDTLIKVQAIMHEKGLRALPVVRDGSAAGVITIEDIGRVYAMMSHAV